MVVNGIYIFIFRYICFWPCTLYRIAELPFWTYYMLLPLTQVLSRICLLKVCTNLLFQLIKRSSFNRKWNYIYFGNDLIFIIKYKGKHYAFGTFFTYRYFWGCQPVPLGWVLLGILPPSLPPYFSCFRYSCKTLKYSLFFAWTTLKNYKENVLKLSTS